MPPTPPPVAELSNADPGPTPGTGSDQPLVWPVPGYGGHTSVDAPPAIWSWFTPSQLRDLWTRLIPDARATTRQQPLIEVNAVQGLFGFRAPGVLQSLPKTAPLRVAQWQHALQVGVRNRECGPHVLPCQIMCYPRDGTWMLYPTDRAIGPLRPLRVEDLVARRMSAVQSAPEAGQVLRDLAKLTETGVDYRLVAKMMDPATVPWWYSLSGKEWQVLLDLPIYPHQLHRAVADRLREAPDAWKTWALTADDWTAFLQHPTAAIREAAVTSLGPSASDRPGPVSPSAPPRVLRSPAAR